MIFLSCLYSLYSFLNGLVSPCFDDLDKDLGTKMIANVDPMLDLCFQVYHVRYMKDADLEEKSAKLLLWLASHTTDRDIYIDKVMAKTTVFKAATMPEN